MKDEKFKPTKLRLTLIDRLNNVSINTLVGHRQCHIRFSLLQQDNSVFLFVLYFEIN